MARPRRDSSSAPPPIQDSSATITRPSYASVVRRRPDWAAEDVDPQESVSELLESGSRHPPIDPPEPPWRRVPDGGNPNGSGFNISLDDLMGARPSSRDDEWTASSSRRYSWLDAVDSSSRSNRPSHYNMPALRQYQALRPIEPIPLPSTGTRDTPSGSQSGLGVRGHREGSWDLAIERARRQGYSSGANGGTAMARNGATSSGQSTTARRSGPTITARRTGPPLGRASIWETRESEDIFPYPYSADGRIEEDLTDEEEVYRPGETSRSRLYGQENRTAVDLTVLGGSGGNVSLRRGGNNRRRRSLFDRLGQQLQAELEATQQSLDADQDQTAQGLEPTNTSLVERHPPLFVRTSGLRKERDKEDDVELLRRRAKRPKLSVQSLTPPERPSYLRYTLIDSETPLPMAFGAPDRASSLTLDTHPVNSILRPRITFSFKPAPSESDSDLQAAALRTTVPIPSACGIHYFELEVLDAGEKGHMSVGWMEAGGALGRLVGWDKGSWGWHGDDGKSFEGFPQGQPFGAPWGAGDVVGCGVDLIKRRAFFTKNGKFIDYRFKNLGAKLYPAVGLRTYRESVVVNLTGPFLFDIDGHVLKTRDEIWTSMLNFGRAPSLRESSGIRPVQAEKGKDKELILPIARSSRSSVQPPRLPDLEAQHCAVLALGYLQHEGYNSTFSLVKRAMERRKWVAAGVDSDAPSPDILPSVEADDVHRGSFPSVESALKWLGERIRVCDRCQIPWDLIVQLCTHNSASISTASLSPNLKRRLSIQEFLYSLRNAADSTSTAASMDMDGLVLALEKGKDLMKQCKVDHWQPSEEKAMKEAFGLLSIPPKQWDEGSIGGAKSRAKLAREVATAIRRLRGMPALDPLQSHFTAFMDVLPRLAKLKPEATFVDIRRMLPSVELAEAEEDTS